MNITANILLITFLQGSADGISLVMTLLTVIAFLICWGVNRISILRIRRNSV